ncbi:MAG: hypothetical protein PHP86_03180 [Nevskiales bacterium]|nr:hypothetical protein [Nevskiales bacterium]
MNSAAATAAARGLDAADFRLTCTNGFGDGWNHYAHSMAWFEGRIFVGTTRGTMAMNKWNVPRPEMRPWPVDSPEYIYDVPRQAEIWCYTPDRDRWHRAYQAPLVTGRNKQLVPRYIGFRGMTVFQGASDHKPCLYVSTWAPALAEPPEILRSEDGVHFEPVPRPPFPPTVRSFRTLQVFGGRVHTTPTSSTAGARRASDSIGSEATIYATDDLQSANWRPVCDEGFGQADNVTVFEMHVFDGHLYAATVNRNGLELWKTPGGEVPYRWTRVLQRGAWRGAFDEVGVALCDFNGALYIGTGVLNGGYHRAFQIGPAAAEILRVWPDDSWDLLVGDPRVTPDGLRYPLSGYSSGFDNMFAGYVWRMAVHDDYLYAGTFSWASALPFLPMHVWPEDVVALVHRWGVANLVRHHGGCELWRSRDGAYWEPVTRNGFGNPYNWGIRNIVSTPGGLYVATANPYGPTIAQQQENGDWAYGPNPRGGCEVWRSRPPTPAGAPEP